MAKSQTIYENAVDDASSRKSVEKRTGLAAKTKTWVMGLRA